MHIRDRIKQFRRVKASALRPNPKNWRTHPVEQRDALRGVLAEIGYVDALLVRELSDGSLQLVDGHLRAETTPDAQVPVLVLDVSEQEADKLLATLDPLAALAGRNQQSLDELLATVQTNSEAVQAMLDQLATDVAAADGQMTTNQPSTEPEIPDAFQVLVQCQDEQQQRALYQHLTAEGYSCRVITL